MRQTLPILAFTLLVTTTTVPAEERPPNVVILFTDDQGTLDANCYGSADLKTPSIEGRS